MLKRTEKCTYGFVQAAIAGEDFPVDARQRHHPAGEAADVTKQLRLQHDV
jgi:hypothetical protein